MAVNYKTTIFSLMKWCLQAPWMSAELVTAAAVVFRRLLQRRTHQVTTLLMTELLLSSDVRSEI